MSQFTAWMHTDMRDGGVEGVAVRLAATEIAGALREAQGELVTRPALGASAGFRVFDDLDGRLVHEGRLRVC